jgi:hypothetical protein
MFNSYRDKLRYQIQRENNARPSSGKGIVKKTYPESYTCDIMIVEDTDPRFGRMALNVPLPMVGGMSYSLPHSGDVVFLNYLNGDPNYPHIVAVYPSTALQAANHGFIERSTVAPMTDVR